MVDYTKLIEFFGGFGILIIVLMRAAPVVWAELVKWSDRGLRFFDKLETSLDTTVARQQEHNEQGKRHEDLSWRIHEEVERLDEKCDRIIERMGMTLSEPKRSRRRRRQSPNDPASSPPATAPGTPPTSSPTPSSPPS